jgi:hypothetical protein
VKTLRVCPDNLRHVKQESLACGIARQSKKPLGSRMMMYARLVALREVQSAAGEELRRRRTLLPSVLDRAFKGEL